MKTNRLYRSRQQVVGGVCSGIASYLNIDVAIVRLITLVAILFGGVSFWLYVLAWVIIPLEPKAYTNQSNDSVVIIEDEKPEPVKPSKQKDTQDNGPEW